MEIQKLLVTGRLHQSLKNLLIDKTDKALRFLPESEVTEEDLAWADGFIGFKPTANFQFLNIKWVHSLGAGVDGFLLNPNICWPNHVLLTKTIAPFGHKISEYCLSYILSDLQLHKDFQQQREQMKWYQLEPKMIRNQNVVIFGTGSIGKEIAKALKFFGASVYGVSLSGEQHLYYDKVVKLKDCKEVLYRANWVINTLPLTNQTQNLFNHRMFCLLNKAVLINVGRGKTVNEKSLIEALEQGNLRSAILDVFYEEPLSEKSELWQHPQIIITPHISALTSPEEAAASFLDTLQRIESGHPLENQVDILKAY